MISNTAKDMSQEASTLLLADRNDDSLILRKTHAAFLEIGCCARHGTGPFSSIGVYLTREQAQQLRDRLTYWIEQS